MRNTMSPFKNFVEENKFILLFCTIFFLFKLPLLNFPLYWDEPAYNDIRLWDNLSLIFPWDTTSLGLNSHPNALQVILGVYYSVFGKSIWVTHLLALTISIGTLYFGFKIQSIIYNRTAAILGTLFFSISTLFFAQSTQLLPDIPTLFFGLGSGYYFIKQKNTHFVLFAIGLGLVAESGLAFSAAIFSISCFHFLKKETSFKRVLLSLVPSISLLYYFLKQKIVRGDFIYHPAIVTRSSKGFDWLSIENENFEVLTRMNDFILYSFHPLLLIFLFLGLLVLISKKKIFNSVNEYFNLIFALAFYAFFFIYGDYHPRNILPVYYLITLLLGVVVSSILKKQKVIGLFCILACSLVIGKQNFIAFDTGDSTYSTYVDEVDLCKKTLKYFSDNNLPTPVYATFPIAYFFEDIGSGYFKKKYDVIPYYSDGQWNYDVRENANTVIITNIEDNHDDPEVNDWVAGPNWELVKTLSTNKGKSWIYIRK